MKFAVTLTFEATDKIESERKVLALHQAAKGTGYEFATKSLRKVGSDPAPKRDGIVIYTDGGCDLKKGGLGAWGYRIEFPDDTPPVSQSQAYTGTTNNRMEMMAVIFALEQLDPSLPATIVSDSMYVISGSTEWLQGWKRRGWRSSTGDVVKNRGLWEIMDALLQDREITFEHVKGHTGDTGNEFVDSLCTQAMRSAELRVHDGQHVPTDTGA